MALMLELALANSRSGHVMFTACSIYDGITRVTGPIYDYNHCRTRDIAETQVRHITWLIVDLAMYAEQAVGY